MLVPKDGTYTKKNYCLSAYEMREVNGRAVSTNQGKPWTLSHTDAKAQCKKQGYILPHNDLWQAMGRNAERIGENWTGGFPGQGELHQDVKIQTSGGFATLFDVGGSMWEHVDGNLSGDPGVQKMRVQDMGQGNMIRIGWSPRRNAKAHFGPAMEIHPGQADMKLGFISGYDPRSKTIMRGGDSGDPLDGGHYDPGLFGVAMNHGPDDWADDSGFRCAY